MKDSYRRYYEANKEKIKAQMRERAKKYRDKITADEKAKENERMKERYYDVREKSVKDTLERLLNDPAICDTFKAFVRECVLPNVGRLTPGFVKTLRTELSIVAVRTALPESPVE